MTASKTPELDPSHPLYQSLKRLVDGLTVILKLFGISEEQLRQIVHESYSSVSLPDTHQHPDPDFIPETSPFLAAMISYWHSEPDYLDHLGSPLAIPKAGPSPSLEAIYQHVLKTFHHLKTKVSLDEAVHRLQRHGNVVESDGAYSVLERHFITNMPGSGGHSSLSYAADFLHTCAHNSLKGSKHGYFQRTSNTPRFPADKVALIDQRLRDQGMDFLEQMDNIIEREKLSDPSDTRESVRLLVGIYLAVPDHDSKDP